MIFLGYILPWLFQVADNCTFGGWQLFLPWSAHCPSSSFPPFPRDKKLISSSDQLAQWPFWRQHIKVPVSCDWARSHAMTDYSPNGLSCQDQALQGPQMGVPFSDCKAKNDNMEKKTVDGMTFYNFTWGLKYNHTSRPLVPILFQLQGA